MSLLPLPLVVHIALAPGLLLPSILLPFALRSTRPATESRSRMVRPLLVPQAKGARVFGLGHRGPDARRSMSSVMALMTGKAGLLVSARPSPW